MLVCVVTLWVVSLKRASSKIATILWNLRRRNWSHPSCFAQRCHAVVGGVFCNLAALPALRSLADTFWKCLGQCFAGCRDHAALGDETRHEAGGCHVEGMIEGVAPGWSKANRLDAPIVRKPRDMRDLPRRARFDRHFGDAIFY